MELQDGETIFDKMNTTYDEFRTTENNIAKVREYYKEKAKKARKHEMPWWISSEDDEKPINFTLRLWNSVDADERKNLIAYCLILFPEIWMPDANSRTKYNQASLWLCSFAQVVFPNIRDAFTAGGKVAFENGRRLTTRYPQVYKTIIEHLPIIKQLLESSTYRPRQNRILAAGLAPRIAISNVGRRTACDRHRLVVFTSFSVKKSQFFIRTGL